MDRPSSHSADAGILSKLTGASLGVVLVAAPFAYACTRPGPLYWLAWILHGVGALWILGLLVDRRKPAIPRFALGACGLLIAYAWGRYWFFEPEGWTLFTRAHFSRIYDRWPESIILRTPYRITLLSSGLMLAALAASDCARRTTWRRTFLYCMAGSGAGMAILGLVQNATYASGIFWETPKTNMPSQFFGTFYHFTSAGAFLNLTWPISASMALFAFKQHTRDGKPIAAFSTWCTLAVITLIGHLGHVSRYPQVIAAVVLLALLMVHRPFSSFTWSWQRTLAIATVCAVIALGTFGVVGHGGKLGDIASRWRMLNIWGNGEPPPSPPARAAWPSLMRDDLMVPYDHSHYFLHDRGASYAFAWSMFVTQPALGFGLGGWTAAVSQYALDPTLGTFFHYLQFTHEDFLQTLVEWGAVGTLFWAVFLFGGLRSGIRRVRVDAKRPIGRAEVRPQIIGALAALFAVLAQALVDFPLQIPANALYACILLAICWSSAPRPALTKKHVHEQ